MKDDKIQTGLRIPQNRYNELKRRSDESGISLNALILFLVDIGLSAINRGVEEEVRSGLHNRPHTGEQ